MGKCFVNPRFVAGVSLFYSHTIQLLCICIYLQDSLCEWPMLWVQKLNHSEKPSRERNWKVALFAYKGDNIGNFKDINSFPDYFGLPLEGSFSLCSHSLLFLQAFHLRRCFHMTPAPTPVTQVKRIGVIFDFPFLNSSMSSLSESYFLHLQKISWNLSSLCISMATSQIKAVLISPSHLSW